MKRRLFLQTLALTGGSIACGSPQLISAAQGGRDSEDSQSERGWLTLLGTSLATEHDYHPRIEGRLPDQLRGTLYRNGPGLFERDGYRKHNLLDGDGMIQAFDFTDGRVRYRNRFVRTKKFNAEQAAGTWLYPTWTTLAPHWWQNLGGNVNHSQAGVTPLVRNGQLLAADEVGLPYTLDPASLETTGTLPLPGGDGMAFKAHTRIDPDNGDWTLVGVEYGRDMVLHSFTLNQQGSLRSHHQVQAPWPSYFHDFFLTPRYIVVVVPDLDLSLFPFLLGLHSFTDSLQWNGKRGNQVIVIDRSEAVPPTILDAPPSFIWHGLNAYDRGDEIVADLVGYDQPDHFLGPDAAFAAIMRGQVRNARYPGMLRRYIIAPKRKRVREERLADGPYEFPGLNPTRRSRPHRYGYFSAGGDGNVYHQRTVRVDVDSGMETGFDFGPRTHVTEPVFVPRPTWRPGSEGESGWLLVQGLDGNTGHGFLVVLDAQHMDAGPLAKVLLRHHTPMGFHGCWHPIAP